MCLSVPAKVVSVEGSKAKVDWEGSVCDVNVSMLPDLKEGDYILVHESTNMAIQKLEAEDAEEIFELVKKCGHHHSSIK